MNERSESSLRLRWSIWGRAAALGLSVGMLQVIINQGDVWLEHEATTLTVVKSVVSPLITSSVALASAAATWVERRKESEIDDNRPMDTGSFRITGQIPQ